VKNIFDDGDRLCITAFNVPDVHIAVPRQVAADFSNDFLIVDGVRRIF